jgi:hypothetical protein
MERKQAEMKQMREEMSKYIMQIDDQKVVIGKSESRSQVNLNLSISFR